MTETGLKTIYSLQVVLKSGAMVVVHQGEKHSKSDIVRQLGNIEQSIGTMMSKDSEDSLSLENEFTKDREGNFTPALGRTIVKIKEIQAVSVLEHTSLVVGE